MLGAVVIVGGVATALVAAASLRPESVVSWLLTSYLLFVTEAVVTTLALSPTRSLTQGSLAGAQALLLAAALVVWVRADRPLPSFAGAREATRQVAADPLTVLFVCAVTLIVGYELFLVLRQPPTNWDALRYHLARTAAWVQYHGYHWIANAPEDSLNTRQPVAEQVILFLFVATRSTRLFALPQFVAELAILASIYGSARRLGYAVRPSACAALLFATFSLVMLEAITAQNDLVAASFPAVAGYLLLGERTADRFLGGAALGIGLGVKLTTAFVWPVLIVLAALRGRRALVASALGAVSGFSLVGVWGYLLNVLHTGHPLGQQGPLSLNDISASPSYPGSLMTGLDLLYKTMDRAVLSNIEVDLFAATGLVAAIATILYRGRRSSLPGSADAAFVVALPFLAPLLVIGIGGVLAYLARWWGHPVRGQGGTVGSINHYASEDQSAFGPIGTVVLLGVPALTGALYAARRVDLRQLALALALPVFFVLTALFLTFNAFLTRFLLVPAALTAPLLARLFKRPATIAAYAVAGCVVGGLTITNGRPWTWNQPQRLPGNVPSGLVAYRRAVPAGTCVGAILDSDEPSFLLYGPGLEYHLEYLSANDPLTDAVRDGVFYVVISTGPNRPNAALFRQAGWTILPLGGQWLLARDPRGSPPHC